MSVFDHLYAMDSARKRGEVWATLDHPFDLAFAIFRGKAEPPDVMNARKKGGTRLYDYIAVDGGVPFLLSQRVIRLLQEQHFSGWRSAPVRFVLGKHEVIYGYHAFCVTGRCGAIDDSKSIKVRRPPPVRGGRAYDAWLGLYFDLETWDGSDIFIPAGRHRTIVTERVKCAMQDAEVSNIEFERLSDARNMSVDLMED